MALYLSPKYKEVGVYLQNFLYFMTLSFTILIITKYDTSLVAFKDKSNFDVAHGSFLQNYINQLPRATTNRKNKITFFQKKVSLLPPPHSDP